MGLIFYVLLVIYFLDLHQVLETTTYRNVGKGCVQQTQSGRTLPQTLRKRELHALGLPFSGRMSPHSLEMFSISPLQAYSFRCWFSNNSVQSFFARMLSKFICGRNCHFLLRPFIPTIQLLFFRSGGIVMLLFSLIILLWQDHVLLLASPFNRSVV